MLIERDEPLPELNHAAYNDFVSRVELLDISMSALKSEFIPDAYDVGGGNITFEIAMECLRDSGEDGQFMATGSVKVKAKSNKTRRICKRVECTMRALYRADGEFDDAMLSHFERNALLNLWPYLREAVHQNSIKMEGPEFVLPLLRI